MAINMRILHVEERQFVVGVEAEEICTDCLSRLEDRREEERKNTNIPDRP